MATRVALAGPPTPPATVEMLLATRTVRAAPISSAPAGIPGYGDNAPALAGHDPNTPAIAAAPSSAIMERSGVVVTGRVGLAGAVALAGGPSGAPGWWHRARCGHGSSGLRALG